MSGSVAHLVTPLAAYKGPLSQGREIWLKDETQQVTGSFKFRGNVAKMRKIPPGTSVVTASTGNHGYAVATAAKAYGLKPVVCIPAATSVIKRTGIAAAGAEVVLVEGDYACALERAHEYAASTGALYISGHDLDTIEGYATMLEEIDQSGLSFDSIIVPVGGGGLLSACLLRWGGRRKIFGAQCQTAPAMQQSLIARRRIRLNEVHGPAEGLLVKEIEPLPFDICSRFMPPVILLESRAITDAIASLWIHNQIRAEGAGAAALAAALSTERVGRRCLCVVSGGNIDDDLFQSILDQSAAIRS